MRLLGKAHQELGKDLEALKWFRLGTAEAPNTREPWFDLSVHCYKLNLWVECYAAAKSALLIEDKSLVYTMDPTVWGYRLHDLAAISAYHLGLYEDAVKQGYLAIKLEPLDARLLKNLEFYKEKI
jgi:tetratricopeptide (TPR) repeat protein